MNESLLRQCSAKCEDWVQLEQRQMGMNMSLVAGRGYEGIMTANMCGLQRSMRTDVYEEYESNVIATVEWQE
jgi:hypothetical protein